MVKQYRPYNLFFCVLSKLVREFFCFAGVIVNVFVITGQEFEFININEGISKLGVSSIVQDNKGYIWLATNGSGLHRYDGIGYTTYRHSLKDTTSINSSMVYSTFLDKKNRLWIGTEEGLNLYDNKLDCFKRFPIKNKYKEKSVLVSIRSIQEDNENNLLLGTSTQGVFKFNMNTHEVTKLLYNNKEDSLLNINDIKINNEGIVFIATNKGLLEYDRMNNKLKKSYYFKNEVPVFSLLIDNENVLWIGTEDQGIYKIENNSQTITQKNFPLTNKKIFSIIKYSNGTLICGTENEGLIHFNENGKLIKHYIANKADEKSISSNSIWSLLLDQNQRLWLGYYNSGVGIYDRLHDKFKQIESSSFDTNSLKMGSVTGIVEDEAQKLWLTMDGGGVDIYDVQKNTFEHINIEESTNYSGITSNYLECIFIDSKQNIWIGSWDKGLFFLEKGSHNFINYTIENTQGDLASNTVLSIAEDQQGKIWIGTFYKGLHSFDPKTKKMKHYDGALFIKNDLAESDIRKVIVDANQKIWVGTTRGLFKIEPTKGGDFVIHSMINEMSLLYNNVKSSSHILSIYESLDKKYIWIGTKGAGLCRYSVDQHEFTWYNKLNGLAEENVAGIIESSEGDLWISGNQGIFKYNQETERFINYTYKDGLLSNDFNINSNYRDTKGQLYFGNYKGVDFFNPKFIKKNINLTKVYLTDLKIFNKKISPNSKDSPLKKVISETQSITLTNKQSVFSIEYTGLNYTRPEKNQYAYYLEGLEKSWNYVGNSRSATYTNLNPGTYVFKLKAANNDGVWNEEPLRLEINILPPWWKTNWAVFLYVSLLILGVYLLNKLTKNRIKEKQAILNERKKREQEDELNEKKLQFFTNISHELRTPLTLILNPIEDILNDTELNLPEQTINKHRIIKKNTNRLYRLVNEIMDFRKLESDKIKIKAEKINLENFTKEIASYFNEEAQSKHIDFTFKSDTQDISVWADMSMLEKIIFNILSNAFKVTPEYGTIQINLFFREKRVLPAINEYVAIKAVEIVISDTGPGLEQNQIEKIFDRFYQVENLNKTYYGGTGIGLEVVQSFVKLHKGEIAVSSKVGKGSSFSILLPYENQHFLEHEIREKETTTQNKKKETQNLVNQKTINYLENSTQDKTRKKKTILIVEDNSELRNYLKEELSYNYHVEMAINGKEGLELANKILPDVIITDVIMPEMNGYELCKKIKTNTITNHIPVLMLTAKSQTGDEILGLQKGADAYMVKPFDMALVKIKLKQLINSRQLIFDKYFREISGIDDNTRSANADKKFIQEILNYITENLSEPNLSVELLASKVKLSRSQLYRKIKTLTGYSANEFIRRIRLQKAKMLIENGATNIKEVCYKVGFSSPSYFTKCFKTYYGILPTEIGTTILKPQEMNHTKGIKKSAKKNNKTQETKVI